MCKSYKLPLSARNTDVFFPFFCKMDGGERGKRIIYTCINKYIYTCVCEYVCVCVWQDVQWVGGEREKRKMYL